ncbi:PLP-dependent transferase [Epithele typhae]|uniref:PLP-dependent transferase n=1 Tax=Epithele typhae TaxID=378194 RepID=UPI002007AC56|nr:PLP-dependent transferase [Epithele typhae]KAH9935193.1 PLP-dependent transferase [Epithele typhae]
MEQNTPIYALSDERNVPSVDGCETAYKTFIKEYPQYQLTWAIDALRRTDFARIDSSQETYVDYMGGCVYPASLVRVHADFLQLNVLGNTHSVNNSSQLSSRHANEARQAVLDFFNAPPGYVVVFTQNASGALKLVGESFPFRQGSNFILSADSHNSVHGIRKFAEAGNAQVHYIEATNEGGCHPAHAMVALNELSPPDANAPPSLFALTAQSNITNTKNPLSLIEFAQNRGFSTLLDAAALVPTSTFSLTEHPVDAMAVSFYKMFGFPTGIGALIAKKSFLAKLERPWFAGGTVDVVQAPGAIARLSEVVHERFEDGTINYTSMPAITNGLHFLSAYLPFLPIRLSALTRYLIASLEALRHDTTGTPVVRVLSRRPKKAVKTIGQQSDTGSTVSLLFLDPHGTMIPNSFIEHAAAAHRISLRTGCMCNPGGAAAMLDLRAAMAALPADATLRALEARVGRELGVVRVSLGLASDFRDAWRVVAFARGVGSEAARGRMWSAWVAAKVEGQGAR